RRGLLERVFASLPWVYLPTVATYPAESQTFTYFALDSLWAAGYCASQCKPNTGSWRRRVRECGQLKGLRNVYAVGSPGQIVAPKLALRETMRSDRRYDV